MIKEPFPTIPPYVDLEPEEVWEYKTPLRGDHIRVSRGLYTHHGIFVTAEEVIHFTGEDADNVLDWSKNEVIQTDIAQFLRGGNLEVKLYTEDELMDLYPVEGIVSYARVCLGDRGYNLIFNNCEHFANMCTLGRFRSRQVERVLGGKNEMGIFSKIGGAIKSIFGGGSSSGGSRSTSSTTTTYDPDKVKVAEIEKETKLRLAGLENERIELAKRAQIELMEKQLYCQEALIEAKARGLGHTAQVLVTLGEKLNEITKQRLEIIEAGSMTLIADYERFYEELKKNVHNEYDEFAELKLPTLLTMLEKFEEGSASHDLYKKNIDQMMGFQLTSMTEQLAGLQQRQRDVQQSVIRSKETLIEQHQSLTTQLLEHVQQQQLELGLDTESRKALLAAPSQQVALSKGE